MTVPDPKTVIRIARACGIQESALPIDLGQRVRTLRKQKDWTLEQAARQAGLARSTLSKIENGQISGRMALTRPGEGQCHITTTYEHEMLADQLAPKQMLPYRARIRARALDEFGGWVRHDGEEFLYVLTGTIRLYTEFFEPVDMQRGDSAYYDAAMGHNVVSTSAEDAMILWVTALV